MCEYFAKLKDVKKWLNKWNNHHQVLVGLYVCAIERKKSEENWNQYLHEYWSRSINTINTIISLISRECFHIISVRNCKTKGNYRLNSFIWHDSLLSFQQLFGLLTLFVCLFCCHNAMNKPFYRVIIIIPIVARVNDHIHLVILLS